MQFASGMLFTPVIWRNAVNYIYLITDRDSWLLASSRSKRWNTIQQTWRTAAYGKDLKVCFLKLFLFFLWRLSGFKVRHLCKTSRENDLRERIPHTWPSSHSSSSLLGSVSYCVVILRTPLISRLEWSHVILNLAGNSFHCRSRTAIDIMWKLGITFVDESKDLYPLNTLARVADEE